MVTKTLVYHILKPHRDGLQRAIALRSVNMTRLCACVGVVLAHHLSHAKFCYLLLNAVYLLKSVLVTCANRLGKLCSCVNRPGSGRVWTALYFLNFSRCAKHVVTRHGSNTQERILIRKAPIRLRIEMRSILKRWSRFQILNLVSVSYDKRDFVDICRGFAVRQLFPFASRTFLFSEQLVGARSQHANLLHDLVAVVAMGHYGSFK